MGGLAFDDAGWLEPNSYYNVTRAPSPRFWPGMHRYLQMNFDNRMQGTITHYDALYSAERAVRGFTRNKKGPSSTHFIIARNGKLYQLVSIKDRAWHAALKKRDGKPIEWLDNGGKFPMANGRSTANPNQWFIGIDFSNLGHLTEKKGEYWSSIGTKVPVENVFFDPDNNSKPWENYTEEALETYVELQTVLGLTLDLKEAMNYRHSDVSPTRKSDPGPALPFELLIDEAYEDVNWYRDWDLASDDSRMGSDGEC